MEGVRAFERRTVLKGALAGVLGLSAARWAPAASGGLPSEAATTRLSDTVAVVTGVGGNVLVLSHDEGQLLVDGGAREHTRALMRQLHALPGRGHVRTLFNTHWHSEQTGSNETFGRAGAKIIAHEKTRLWLATDHYVPAEDRYEKARRKEAQPTETFYTTGATMFGGERIEYGYLLEAHTAGDIYVYFRDSNVLAVGDAVAPVGDPVLDWYSGGWLGGRLDALALLLNLCNEQTRIIAGTGPVIGRAQLQAEHDELLQVFNRLLEMVRKGLSPQDMLESGAVTGLNRTFKDPRRFLYDAHKGIWAHHNTLSHDVV